MDAIVQMHAAGNAKISFMIGFRFRRFRTSRIRFATKLRMKYITPCFTSVFHSVEVDGILKSPIMVSTKSTKSYNMLYMTTALMYVGLMKWIMHTPLIVV